MFYLIQYYLYQTNNLFLNHPFLLPHSHTNMATTWKTVSQIVEPYKVSEIFVIIHEYASNLIFLNNLICSCTNAQTICDENQLVLLVLYIKNKWRDSAAELVNSRYTTTWDDIRIRWKSLLVIQGISMPLFKTYSEWGKCLFCHFLLGFKRMKQKCILW